MENENWDHLSVLVMNGNGPLFSIHSALVFTTTSDDIFLISRVLYICCKLLHQTSLAAVCQTKALLDVLQTGE